MVYSRLDCKCYKTDLQEICEEIQIVEVTSRILNFVISQTLKIKLLKKAEVTYSKYFFKAICENKVPITILRKSGCNTLTI